MSNYIYPEDGIRNVTYEETAEEDKPLFINASSQTINLTVNGIPADDFLKVLGGTMSVTSNVSNGSYTYTYTFDGAKPYGQSAIERLMK